MHPLSVFPQLFYLGLVGPLLLRLGTGFFVLYLAKNRYQKVYKWSSVIYALSGLLLVLGLYTQPSAIVAILALIFDFYAEDKNTLSSQSGSMSKEKQILYLLAGMMLLSLLFTGPGFFAFDLPL